ncbi:MAG TPA: hypothetical protein VGG10_13525 [Rhizomicrobium sp.]|jgi:hypothetical protein
MLIRAGLGVFALMLLSAPAFAANQCDASTPMAPAVPTPAQITAMSIPDAQNKLNEVYKDLHLYQAQLKDYRACLSAAMNQDQDKVNSAPAQKDPTIKKAAQDEYADYTAKFNATVDSEQSLASQINADAKAHCARDTTDFCKPKN